MENIKFLDQSYQKFRKDYQDLEEDAAHYFQLLLSRKKNQKLFDYAVSQNVDEYQSAEAIDLLIADDDYGTIDNIIQFVRADQPCKFIQNVLLCDDQSTLDLLAGRASAPKIVLLDFYFNSSNINQQSQLERSIRTYQNLKTAWPSSRIIGLSQYANHPEATKLRELMQEYGDDVYNKSLITGGLGQVILNNYQLHESLKLAAHLSAKKQNAVQPNNIQECLAELNSALLSDGMYLVTTSVQTTLFRLLDEHERVMAFVKDQGISIKSSSMAACIIVLQKRPDFELTKKVIQHFNLHDYEGFEELPEKPLSTIQRHLNPFEYNGVVSKAAIFCNHEFKRQANRWPVTIEHGRRRVQEGKVQGGKAETLLDNIFVILGQQT